MWHDWHISLNYDEVRMREKVNIVIPSFIERYATKLTLDEIYASGIDIEDSSSAPISSSASRRQNICNVDVPENTSPIARTEQDEQEIFQQLASFEKTYRFCPYDEVPYWMHEKTSHIVSISADGDTNILRIFNYENDGVEFAVGELSRQCVEGIWGSLNTELLYFTSDDDERYSIQVGQGKCMKNDFLYLLLLSWLLSFGTEFIVRNAMLLAIKRVEKNQLILMNLCVYFFVISAQ